MMLRVEWNDEYNRNMNGLPRKLQGTITGYVQSSNDTYAVVLQD